MEEALFQEPSGLSKSRSAAAWVVYSTVPERLQAAAFHDKALAVRLHQELCDSEAPVLLDESEIEVSVNEFSEQLKNGLTPYTVVLENGELLREDTYDSEIFNIKSPSFEPEQPEIFSGTFWAPSISEAVDKAQSEWKLRIKQ